MSAETVHAQPDIESFELDDLEGFDIAGAVMGAMHDTLSDEAIALNEKVVRFEQQLEQATSVFALGFRELQEMAAMVELFCAHDHELGDALTSSETVSSFLTTFTSEDEHDHTDDHKGKGRKSKKKKKKDSASTRMSMFDVMMAVRKARKKK